MHLYVAYYRNRTNLTEIIIILSRVCSALGSEPSSFSSVLIKNNRNNNSMLTVSSWHSNLPITTRYSIFTRHTIHSWWPLGTECSLASNSEIVWGCDTTKTMWKQQWIIVLYSFDFLEDWSNNFKITTSTSSTGFFPKIFHIISILFDLFIYLYQGKSSMNVLTPTFWRR